LLVDKQWEKHLEQIEKINEYMIVARFMFKQLDIIVIMVYMPPNDKEKRKMLQKTIIDCYIKRLPRTQIIVMGDFNCVADASLDRKLNQEKRQIKPNPLLNWFKRQEFKDVYRTVNPDLREYSWSRGDSESRIDYI